MTGVQTCALPIYGIVLRSQWDIAGALAAKTLVRVLPKYAEPAPVVVAVPNGQFVPARVAALVKFLETRVPSALNS